MPDGLFGMLAGNKPYAGMYPGADPYGKAEMVKEKIPSASQEALQSPRVDPINVATLGGANLATKGAGMTMDSGGELGKYIVNGLFGYLLNQAVHKVKNTSIDKFNEVK